MARTISVLSLFRQKANPPPVVKVAADPQHHRCAEGRRAVQEGRRPKLLTAMAHVMGDKVMDSTQIATALSEKGWLPNSAKPQEYLNWVLATYQDHFERVRRGAYRVRRKA